MHSWRLYIAISAVPALIGALLYLLLPESPRFLLEVRERKREGMEERAREGIERGGVYIHVHVYVCCSLQKGREQKAMKALRLAYWLNHLHRSRGQHFPVKSIRLESRRDNEGDGPKGKGVAHRLTVFGGQMRQVCGNNYNGIAQLSVVTHALVVSLFTLMVL